MFSTKNVRKTPWRRRRSTSRPWRWGKWRTTPPGTPEPTADQTLTFGFYYPPGTTQADKDYVADLYAKCGKDDPRLLRICIAVTMEDDRPDPPAVAVDPPVVAHA